VDRYGAKGDGRTDDSAAINRAVAALSQGDCLVFTPGKTYLLVNSNVIVNRRGAKLWGYGATLHFQVPDSDPIRMSIQLVAPETGIYGLKITSNLRRRLGGGLDHHSIVLASDRQEAVDNKIEYTHLGIIVRYGTNFLVSHNSVYRTFADAIHVTTGSSHGIITQNTVRENGDDMIAVVNYGAGEPTVGDVLIENNDVAGNYWGRGISVVGGKDITIRNNHVANVVHAAGIMINAEAYYDTANVRNVLVEGNNIEDIQTTTPAYNPVGAQALVRTQHGGIDINGQGQKTVTDVLVRDNVVRQVVKFGLLVRGNSCGIGFENNTMSEIPSNPIMIESATSGTCTVACVNNTDSGVLTSDPKCSRAMPTTVAGASM
jgi:hypothetical protein